MLTTCGVGSPPPLSAALDAVTSFDWLYLLAGGLVCIGLIRHDWSRLQSGGHRRLVLTLCVVTFVTLFAGAFLLFIIAYYPSVAMTSWYEPTRQRLLLHTCSTTALDAEFHDLLQVNALLARLEAG